MKADEVKTWTIRLEHWVIPDGGYPRLLKEELTSEGTYVPRVAERFPEFALEFDSQEFKRAGKQEKTCHPIEGGRYRICGEVRYIYDRYEEDGDQLFIIDFGLLAYVELKWPEGLAVGQYYEADGELLVDKYYYTEFSHEYEGVPPIVYSWEVLDVEDEYILTCAKLDKPPKLKSASYE